MLRNRCYVGDVYFRGAWHHNTEPFIDPALFDRVQALLDQRGEGYEHRNTDTHPEYLLTGLITCGQCNRRYIGASARGKRHRYRYYLCWTRSRYGTAACQGERIRADALEAAVFDALVNLYADPSVLIDATAADRDQTATAARQHAKELRSVEAELTRTEAAVNRYMLAFENGAVTEDMFGERVRELGHKAKALRVKQAELETATGDAIPTPTATQIRALHRWLLTVAQGRNARPSPKRSCTNSGSKRETG